MLRPSMRRERVLIWSVIVDFPSVLEALREMRQVLNVRIRSWGDIP